MKWKKVEEKIRTELHNTTSEVDAISIWNAIEPEIDALNNSKRKKRRFFFWLLFLGMVISFGGVYWLVSFKNTPSKIISITAQKNQTATNIPNNTSTNKQSDVQKEQTYSKGQPIEENISPLIPEKEIKADFQRDLYKKSANLSKTNNTLIEPINHPSTKKKTKKNNNHSTNPLIERQEITLVDEQTTTIKVGDFEDNTKSTNLGMRRLDSFNKTIASTQTKKLKPILNLLKLPTLSFSSLSLQGVLRLGEQELPFAPTQLNKKSIKRNRFSFSLGLQSGASFVNRKLSGKSDIPNYLLQLRNNKEKPLEALHFGLQLSLRHSSGIELNSGLTKTIITERLLHTQSIVDTLFNQGVQDFIATGNGDSTRIIKIVSITQTTTINQKIYNTYRILEVPFFLGYRKEWNNWSMGLQAGVLANISLKTRGKLLTDETTLVDIQSRQNTIFKTNIGLGYHIGLSFQRKLFSNMELSFSSFIRSYNDITRDDYNISQKYTLFGSNIGLTYRF